MLVFHLICSHELYEEELHNDGAEEAARTCVVPSSEAEGAVRNGSKVETVGVHGLAQVKVSVGVEFLRVGIVVRVVMNTVGMKHEAHAGGKLKAVFECIGLQRVALD